MSCSSKNRRFNLAVLEMLSAFKETGGFLMQKIQTHFFNRGIGAFLLSFGLLVTYNS